MPDKPLEQACDARVCIHTDQILDSCMDKDCVEDLRFYPTASAQEVLSACQMVRGGTAELLYVYTDVEPVTFNRGFYSIDMRFFYRVTLQVGTGTPRCTEAEGLCVFDKRVILFGSEGSAKIFSSDTVLDDLDIPGCRRSNLPTAVVEAVDPIVLDARLMDCCGKRDCDCDLCEVPSFVNCCFDGELSSGDDSRRIYVTLGQFSIVRLERDTQLLIPVYDYCLPEKECTCGCGCECQEDPCEMFRKVQFPFNEFFPPNSIQSKGNTTYQEVRSGCCS